MVNAASAATVTAGAASRAWRACAVRALRSTALSFPDALSTGAAVAGAAAPIIETMRPDEAATTAVRRPAVDIWVDAAWAIELSGVTGRRAARWRARVVLTVTLCLSKTPARSAVGFGWKSHPARRTEVRRASPQGRCLQHPEVGPPSLSSGRRWPLAVTGLGVPREDSP